VQAFHEERQDIELVVTAAQVSNGIQLPLVQETHSAEGEQGTQRAPALERRLELRGGEQAARPDAQPGRGGRQGASMRAINLTDRVAPLHVNREAPTGDRFSQVQRLRTSKRRSSLDDRRATPNPMQLSFVVTGPGTTLERRPRSPWDSASGFSSGAESSRVGGPRGANLLDGFEPARAGTSPGSVERVTLGVPDREGEPSFSARLTTARPPVRQARAAVPANRRARPNDTMNSSHKVDDAIRSLVHAGGLGGPHGSAAGGDPSVANEVGWGGQAGPGAQSRASGRGDGVGAHTADNGLSRYYSRLPKKVNWEAAFPQWAIARGLGGLAVVELTLDQSGGVLSLRIVRPSGFEEFDRNLLSAIRRDAPYGPLPPAAGGSLRVRIAFDATNPAVGRDGGGPGGKTR
jgi:TonB family protein